MEMNAGEVVKHKEEDMHEKEHEEEEVATVV